MALFVKFHAVFTAKYLTKICPLIFGPMRNKTDVSQLLTNVPLLLRMYISTPVYVFELSHTLFTVHLGIPISFTLRLKTG